MTRVVLVVLGVLLFLTSTYSANDDEFGCFIKDEVGRYREHQVDFQKLVLDVKFEPKLAKVVGKADYIFSPIQEHVDTLFLDAPGINIDYVWLNQVETKFTTNDAGVTIFFDDHLVRGKEYQLEIGYIAFPKKGIYFLGWNEETDRLRKQIWTQGQGIDNRHWIPGFDGVTDKLITETNITFDSKYEVVSNGALDSKTDNENGSTTWHYAMSKPHVMYLVMIAIGEYEYKDIVSGSGIVNRQYYYGDRPETFEPTYQYSAEMMDWMEEDLGVPYPWGIYRNVPVQDFLYGAMENTTSTIFTDYYVQDERAALERNYIGTNAHELTHQWFGDYITEWSGTHHWLHESFATHYAKHFERSVFGEDAFQWDRRGEMRSAWNASKKNDLPIAHTKAGSARHYPKGSLVIDMMRYVVGEEGYHRVITNFLKNNSYDMVDSHVLYLEFMKTLGVNMDYFFDQWVYRGGEPHYVVRYSQRGNATVFTVKQAHEINDDVKLFKMPIIFQVHYTDGSYDEVKEWIEFDTHDVSVPNDESKEISYTLFDPNWNVLKTVDFEKSNDELFAQAMNAENMIDRYDALKALADVDPKKKRDELIAIYAQEDFYATKGQIIAQLVNDDNKKSQKLIASALTDTDHKVRRTVLDEVDHIDKKMKDSYEQLLEDESYVTITRALEKLAFDFPGEKESFIATTEGTDGHMNNVAIARLILEMDESPEARDELIDFAGPAFEFRTRLSAMDALYNKNFYNDDYMHQLMDAVMSFNGRLSKKARRYLVEYAQDFDNKSGMLSFLEKAGQTPQQRERANAFRDKLME